MNLYKAMGGGWIDTAQEQADAPAPKSAGRPADAPQPASTAATRPQDRIEVRWSGDTSVVDVFRVKSIGGAQVKAPRTGWPSAVVVRLHGFPDLESFQAKGRTDTLDCELNRVEGRPAQHRCRLGQTDVDALSRTADYFQVQLPSALLAADGSPVELQWVDQWR